MPAATSSPRKAIVWMAGWLTAMVVIAVAGREATRTLHVFQIMEMRSVLGFVAALAAGAGERRPGGDADAPHRLRTSPATRSTTAPSSAGSSP